ncbi:MAG: hypothetical protein IRZ33_06030 [Alicyclobacillaceae bacterium]|nr:hypothetical protein [Alicyclobacillaceae bacterium]
MSAPGADWVLADRRYVDALKDVALAARAVRDGWSQAGWEEFCEALDRLSAVERSERVAVDRRRLEALERLYELVRLRRAAEEAFAEAQAEALPYVGCLDEEIKRTLKAIDELRDKDCARGGEEAVER